MPSFAPWLWNHHPVIDWHNCYDYARDRMAFANPRGLQPGMIGLNQGFASPAQVTQRELVGRAQADALDGPFQTVALCVSAHVLALAVEPGVDYHWYRLDDRRWSHKPGTDEAIDYDNLGAPITDPALAASSYSVFCGYFSGNRITVPVFWPPLQIQRVAPVPSFSGGAGGSSSPPASAPPAAPVTQFATWAPVDSRRLGGTFVAKGGGMMAVAEALVFSGMPNPIHALSAASAEDLARSIARLREPAEAVRVATGYRGFRVTFHDTEAGQLREARIFRGTVTLLFHSGERIVVRDTERLEETLIAKMKDALSELPEGFRPPGLIRH